jgi:hypothetical protein
MGKEFSCTELLAKAGEIVAERAREEAEVLRDKGEVEERMMAELFRVLRLMEMDLAMVKAAVQEETLGERLEQAKASCRQAILVDLVLVTNKLDSDLLLAKNSKIRQLCNINSMQKQKNKNHITIALP